MPEGIWFDAAGILTRHPDRQLYYRTDHHWTTLAAFYTYQAWAKEKGFSPLPLSDYTRETLTTDFKGTIESKVGGQVKADSIERFVPAAQSSYTLIYNQGQETANDLYHMESLSTKDKYGVFFGGNQPLVQSSIENGSSRRLLIVKDSYANCFAPFAFHEFAQVDLLDIRYYSGSVEALMAAGGYTDLLFLYNASGFAEDVSLAKLVY